MLLSKILPKFSKTLSSHHNPFLSPLITRFFGSTDLGKLGEKYHSQMVKKLTKSHESLSLQNLNIQDFIDHTNPLSTSMNSLAGNVKNKVLNNKLFPKKYFKGIETKGEYSKELEEVDKSLLSLIHSGSLKSLYQYFDYDNKLVYPKIIFAFRDFIYQTHKLNKINKKEIDQQLVKLATCFECLTLGFYLHNNLQDMDLFKEKIKKMLYGIPFSLGIVEKYLKDEKILLAGDFFHTKAAKLSAEFGIVEIPYYFALVEESLAKAVIKKGEINDKKEPYDLDNQMFISYHETSLVLASALKGTYIIINKDATENQLESLSNFALNLGAAWHLASEYRKQENVPQNSQKKQEYLVRNFLNNEKSRLHQTDNLTTLVNLRQAHISQAERNLQSFTSNEKETENFVYNVLVPIIANSFSLSLNDSSSQKLML